MGGQIDQLHYFITGAAGALYVQLPVYLLQRATDGRYAGRATSVGTLMLGVLAGPAGDAHLAEQFTAPLALEGIFGNI